MWRWARNRFESEAMIVFLEGILDTKEPTRAVVEAGGVGYELFLPVSSYDRLPAEGQRVRLHVYDQVRADDHLLYGFATAEERRVFLLLMSVTGIGPKLALSVLSGMTPRDLAAAVAARDGARLSRVPGVGKKTAERIILELRDKLSPLDAPAAVEPEPTDPAALTIRDAVLALVALGYKRGDAERLIRAAGAAGGQDVETLVRKALAG